MEYLSWDLSILSRATAYANLSTASAHVGLSQPQLSRIVAKLEEQLGVPLLDRESRRKSSWTPAAHRLAEIYTKTLLGFRAEVNALASGVTPRELKVGTLEGLVPVALGFCHAVLTGTAVGIVQLDILDTSFLEERFAKNDLDLIFTAHDLGARKYRHVKALGYQQVEAIRNGDLMLFSQFEYASTRHKGIETEKAFVSNSLRVRQDWMARYGGTTSMPTPVTPKRTGRKGELTVVAVAHDNMPSGFWTEILQFLKALS
jgi:hypothetical protein